MFVKAPCIADEIKKKFLIDPLISKIPLLGL